MALNVQTISDHRLGDASITWLWRHRVFECYLKANPPVLGYILERGSKPPVSLRLADISKPKCQKVYVPSNCAYLLILLSTSLSLHTCLRAPSPRYLSSYTISRNRPPPLPPLHASSLSSAYFSPPASFHPSSPQHSKNLRLIRQGV